MLRSPSSKIRDLEDAEAEQRHLDAVVQSCDRHVRHVQPSKRAFGEATLTRSRPTVFPRRHGLITGAVRSERCVPPKGGNISVVGLARANANASARRWRCATGTRMKRHGVSKPWSGAAAASDNNASSCSVVGPGSVSRLGSTVWRELISARTDAEGFALLACTRCRFGHPATRWLTRCSRAGDNRQRTSGRSRCCQPTGRRRSSRLQRPRPGGERAGHPRV